MSSGNNNSGILATVGLNPVPSKGFIPTNSITNIQGQAQSIACYSAYNITFVPPYSQFSIANAALNSPANKSLQNIPAQNLYSGTYFTNKIVMAPIQATASLNGTKLSLLLEYPDASGSYTPFPNVLLEQSTTSAPAFTSQNFTSYQITQSFFFPGISSSGQIDPYLLTVNGDQSNALLGIYYSFYFVECTTSTTGTRRAWRSICPTRLAWLRCSASLQPCEIATPLWSRASAIGCPALLSTRIGTCTHRISTSCGLRSG